MNYYICFELISNAYLHNIVFVSNLPPQLKNSGFATISNPPIKIHTYHLRKQF